MDLSPAESPNNQRGSHGISKTHIIPPLPGIFYIINKTLFREIKRNGMEEFLFDFSVQTRHLAGVAPFIQSQSIDSVM